MSSMLKERIEVTSEKHGIKGEILDYGMVIKLRFSHNEKEIEMGMSRPLKREELIRQAIGCMDTYMDQLANESSKRLTMLHEWYISKDEAGNLIGHGIVTGHTRLPDSIQIHTSPISFLAIDKEKEEAVLQTSNTTYHCPLVFLRFRKQDNRNDLIPDYTALKEKYKGRRPLPSIEPGKVLLVLSNFCEYYFYSLYYRPDGADEALKSDGYAHIGTFQDSYLIGTENHEIDLRYFPHYQNIEFYSEDTDGKPFYLENIGDAVLYAATSAGLIRLAPGERKEVSRKNAETEKPALATGDLYPAGIIE